MDKFELGLKTTSLMANEVIAEIHRAEELHGNLPIHNLERVLAIITEEVGEVAEATLEATSPRNTGTLAHLQEEYVHVAAAAIRAAAMLQPMVDDERAKV